jgi:hypothetical protein
MLPREPFLLGSFLRPSLAEIEIKCDEFYRLMAAIDSRLVDMLSCDLD